ncbi:glycoside hydrolase family 2 [Pedobacter sp. HDW13]|uniref:glycoside hydrolase family 2 protein n=1 Tax=Pedobacter sp. HDW13 TaxID=2714940 RepID=UPI00140BF51B|nr:sugar-binding domain-containing protein [Pedobacter sp. HDW13]QIL40294.1 glycoside hydrolase family 2 [Pedobacter sp. HDW13]
MKKILFTCLFQLILISGMLGQEKNTTATGEEVINLAGAWSFRIDSLKTGEQEKWYNKPALFFNQKIKLPGTTDDAGFGNPLQLKPVLKREVMLHLWRKFSYVGAAWYQKEVIIPASWNNRQVSLLLERVIWQTDVWVDGKKVNTQGESLSAPHDFDLSPFFKPGKHTLTVKIDNSKKFDIGDGHAYSAETQIIWNGVIGKIQLVSKPGVYLKNTQVFTEEKLNRIKVVSEIDNKLGKNLRSALSLTAVNGETKSEKSNIPLSLKAGENIIVSYIDIKGPIKKWDEFNPALYNLHASIKSANSTHSTTTRFAFRTLSSKGPQLLINNRPLFLRGTLECNIFPLTGYPPMEKEGWRKVFESAKNYGLNHLRFHSWCPPEAAFEMADEMGFYLQVELPAWSLKIGTDKLADDFFDREAGRMIRYYGNHPSFCFWSMGNEMQGNMKWLSDEVIKLKSVDNRRMYTTTSYTFEKGFGDWPLAADDYFITQRTKKGWVRGQGIFDVEAPSFNKDYTKSVDSLPVPLITHEIGQYAVYPNINEIAKYTGVLAPLNFTAIKDDLARKNMTAFASDFTNASGKLAVLLYKEEIERALKTKNVSGFQLLDLHDFPGQGTALVGVLDAFWDSKGLIKPVDFRKFCAPVVPLIRFEKATYTNNEVFKAQIEVANYGAIPLKNATVVWQITGDEGVVLASGKISGVNIHLGNSALAENISTTLTKVTSAQKLNVSVSIENTTYQNNWSIWVYPEKVNPIPEDVVFTTDYNEALLALEQGKKVLLNPAKEKINGVEGKFVQVFWSPVHFPNQPGTMGLLVDPKHPAFENFPTDNHTDWQWWDLCKKSTTLVLDSIGLSPSAIVVRNIDNFFKNRNMSSVVEAKLGNGKLLLCTMDLHTDINNRPVARQLKYSLLGYIHSSKFNPVTVLDMRNFQKIEKKAKQ